MTNEEKQEIISSVIQSLQTNSATIDQLSEVESCSEGDFIELNKGRKISAENLAKDVSSKVLQEANQAVAESQNYAEKSEESANESEEYSEKSKEYSEEAKRQAVLAGQSGELAQYAKEQGDYAKEQGNNAKEKGEEAVSIAEDAAKRVTNDVLFKYQQALSEEEQQQVKDNLNIVNSGFQVLECNESTATTGPSDSGVIRIYDVPRDIMLAIVICKVDDNDYLQLIVHRTSNLVNLLSYDNTHHNVHIRIQYENPSPNLILTVTSTDGNSHNFSVYWLYYQRSSDPNKFLGNYESEEKLQSVIGNTSVNFYRKIKS